MDLTFDEPLDAALDAALDGALDGAHDQTLDAAVDPALQHPNELPEVASSGGIDLARLHATPPSDGVPVLARVEAEGHVPKNDVADGVPVAAHDDGSEAALPSSLPPSLPSSLLSSRSDGIAAPAGPFSEREARASERAATSEEPARASVEAEPGAGFGRPTDEELLLAWRAGDLVAGERLWRRHAAAIQRFYRNKVARAVANDLTQRSVEACLRARDRIQSFRAYLLSVATRQLFDYIRNERRKRQRDADLETLAIDEAMPSPEEWVGTKREKRILLRALRRIPVIYQVVLELYYWEQLTQNEIAQVLGWPPGTVRTRIGKARRLVRAQIEGLCRSHEERLSTIDSFEQWAARTYHAVPTFSQSGPIDRDEVPPDDDLVSDEAQPSARMARGSMQFAAVGEGTVDAMISDGPDRGNAGEGDGGEGDGGADPRRPPSRR